MGGRTSGKPWVEVVDFVIRKLRERFDVEAVLLHGSWARGGGGDWSDVDLVVITDNVKGMNILDRFYISAEFRRYRVDVVFYTFEELDRMASKGNPLALSALIEGIPIVISSRIEQLRSRIARSYVRKGKVWIQVPTESLAFQGEHGEKSL